MLTFICDDLIVTIRSLLRSTKRLLLSTIVDNITVKGERLMVNFTKVGQFVDFELEILDAKGRVAQVDGDITVSNSNEIAGGVAYDQATRKGRLTCLDEGIGHVDFTADADLGAGVKPIAAVLDFTGPNLSEATVFNVKVGDIQEPAA